MKPPPATNPVLSANSVAGRVGFEFLPDPHSTTPSLSDNQWFEGPVPVEAQLPAYPEQALDKQAPTITVVVRIIVEADGAVKEVLASPLDESLEREDLGLFRTAVGEAVRGWKFIPATINTLVKAPALDGDPNVFFRMSLESKPVRAYIDLRFTFEVMEGRGRVQLGSNP